MVCTMCHGLGTVTMTGRTPDEWTYLVNEMIGLGAPVDDKQAQAIVDYLSRDFPPRP